MLEGFYDSQGLFDVSTHLLVIDGDWSHHSLSVDYEKAPKGCSVQTICGVLNEHPVFSRNLFSDVCNEGDIDVAEPSILPGCFSPGKMGKVRVNWNGQHLSPDFFNKGIFTSEIFSVVAVADDLGGADIGEVEGVEEEDQVFTSEVGKL